MTKTTRPDRIPNAAHERLVKEASQVEKGQGWDCKTPETEAVMTAAMDALQRGLPPSFEYKGRSYWLKLTVIFGMVEVFDAPTVRLPLARVMTGAIEIFGHKPGQ